MTTGYWDFRAPNLFDFIMDGHRGIGNQLRAIYSKYHSDIWIYETIINMEAPDTEAELASGVSHYFDGTSASDEVDVKSASANDAVAGTGVQDVEHLGWVSDKFLLQECETNGATAVSCDTKLERFINTRAIDWGSGGKAAGAITIHEDAGVTETYATIAANNNYGLGTRLYVPTGYNAKVGDLWSTVVEVNDAAADIDPELGAILKLVLDGEDDLKNHESYQHFTVSHYDSPLYVNNINDVLDGGDDAYMAFNHVTKADDKNTTLLTKIRYIIWGDVG